MNETNEITFSVADAVEDFIDFIRMVDDHGNGVRRFQGVDFHHVLDVGRDNLLEHFESRFHLAG